MKKEQKCGLGSPPPTPLPDTLFGQTKLLTHGNSLFQALREWGLVKVKNCVT